MDSMDNIGERFAALEQRTEQLQQQTRTVERRLRWWRGLACGAIVLGLLSGALPSGKTVDAQQGGVVARVAALEDKLVAVTFHAKARELVITRANLRIVNGLEKTDCGSEEEPIPNCPNGLGNLIVGYNEERGVGLDNRTGSHNVVVGTQHNFSRFGGLVVGGYNTISGDFSSVSGGDNTASGNYASVSGGDNTVSGNYASVSGGRFNTASGDYASISGGYSNTANAALSSISGGDNNTASGNTAAVSGGFGNTASGFVSSVSGGYRNTASGNYASVSGGTNRSAPEQDNWRAGTFFSAD